MSSYGKSVQFEEMTTNEDQYGLYINDRWQVNDKLTVNAGLRWEYYPLMQRDNRGFEQLDLNTFQVLLPANSGDAGYKSQKNLFAPRLGAAYRINDDTVFRAGYGRTFNPLPWSRPLRGFYPASIGYSGAGPNAFVPYGTLAQGIPGAPNPDVASGSVPLPRGVDMRTPEVGQRRSAARSTRGTCSSSAACRVTSRCRAGYVGTATNNGYADINLNYAESGGNANRQYAAQAGNASILLWGARTKARYHSLQMALNRPFKNGLLLKGAYTFSKALNEADADGWTGVDLESAVAVRPQLRARRLRPSAHAADGLRLRAALDARVDDVLPYIVKNWQINGIGSCLSGTPFTVGGDNAALQQVGGQQTANVTGEL